MASVSLPKESDRLPRSPEVRSSASTSLRRLLETTVRVVSSVKSVTSALIST